MIKATQLVSTAIMKTDIIGFSSIIGELSDFELSKLLEEYKEFIIRIIYKYDGSIIKGEGDAFLISFSSVTSATEAAIEIQKKLKKQRESNNDKFRLSLKIIISLGDVMHKNNDVYGESVNIISRIEDITPPDEIYLSESAFLTLRKKNINIESAGEYAFKGFSKKQKIFRVILGRKTLILENQFILFSDLAEFRFIINSSNYELLEKTIDIQDIMYQKVLKEFNGSLRNIIGDAYFVTFNKIGDLINAINYINNYWNKVCNEYGLNRMRLGCHKGTFHIYRSCLAGDALNIAARLESIGKKLIESSNYVSTHVSSTIQEEAVKYAKGLKTHFRKVPKKEILDEITPETLKYYKENFKKSTYSYTP